MTEPSKAKGSKRKARKIIGEPMSNHDWSDGRLWEDRKEFADTVQHFNWGICRELQKRESSIILKNSSDNVDRLSDTIRYNYLHMPNEDMDLSDVQFEYQAGETWIEFALEFHLNLKIIIHNFSDSGAVMETIEVEYHDPTRFNPVFVADLMIGEIK